MRQAVVSGGDAAELLEFADGALDAVAMLVDGWVEIAGPVHAGSLRDDRPGADRLGMVEDGVCVIGSVGDEVAGGETGDQRQGIGGVIGLTSGQEKADRAAEAVDRQMPLAGQSASGTPQSLVLDPPFWPVAAWA